MGEAGNEKDPHRHTYTTRNIAKAGVSLSLRLQTDRWVFACDQLLHAISQCNSNALVHKDVTGIP